ncbi:MAG: hypothetical protein GX389_04160 [Clostridiaceae bacterium]|jgi:putative sporulation protein YtxC|nr:hypothetical protein [Clostridiaceae bacterium]
MPSLRVDCLKDIEGLAEYLEAGFNNQDGPANTVISCEDGSLIITFDRAVRKNGRKYLITLSQLSDILAGYILQAYEKNILDKIIQKVCREFSKKDRDEVSRIAYTRLYTNSYCKLGNIVGTRRSIISDKIAEYLRNSNKMSIEGFVTFRLEDYVKHLEIEVERAIRQFLIERQYDEYINLLTAYVKMQVPRVPELNVIVQNNGSSYRVEGTKPFDIPKEIIEGFGISRSNPIIENDDFMIGFLLACAPVRVVIHNVSHFANKELLNTIRIIFSECILLK